MARQPLGFETFLSEPDFGRGAESRVGYMGAPDEVMIAPIAQWAVSARKDDKPFFAAIMTNIGHHPYTLPDGWVRCSYEVESIGAESLDQRYQAYRNCLSYIDGVLERLLAEPKRANALRDTIFVFVGDHGQFFGEHAMNHVLSALYENRELVRLRFHRVFVPWHAQRLQEVHLRLRSEPGASL